jgi:hypothetical protein
MNLLCQGNIIKRIIPATIKDVKKDDENEFHERTADLQQIYVVAG